MKIIKKDIKISGYNNVLEKVKIKDKNVAKYNRSNSILVLFINEKLITSENYLSNKNVNNESKNPINSKTNIKPKGNQNRESKETLKDNRTKSSGKMKINNDDNSNRYGNIGSVTPAIKNMLLVLIDSEKIKKKTYLLLNVNNNKLDKYYLLDLWLLCYLSISEFSDISNWGTSKAINMLNLYAGCSLISELPDISKWDDSKVTSLDSIFCK